MLKFIVPAALAEEERLRLAPTEDETSAMMSRTRAVEHMLASAAQRSPDDPTTDPDPNSNGLGQAATNSDTVSTTASTTTTASAAE